MVGFLRDLAIEIKAEYIDGGYRFYFINDYSILFYFNYGDSNIFINDQRILSIYGISTIRENLRRISLGDMDIFPYNDLESKTDIDSIIILDDYFINYILSRITNIYFDQNSLYLSNKNQFFVEVLSKDGVITIYVRLFDNLSTKAIKEHIDNDIWEKAMLDQCGDDDSAAMIVLEDYLFEKLGNQVATLIAL